MSNARDKLVAISGIVRKIAEERHDDCLAGLWRLNMEAQLLWNVAEKAPRPTIYRAPSWSWAAIDGEVTFKKYETDHQHLKIHILEACIVPLGQDILGELREGVVKVVCETLLHGLLGYQNEEVTVCWNDEDIQIDDEPEHLNLWVCWDSKDMKRSLHSTTMTFPRIYLLPISSRASLVLARTRRKRGQYRRLGVCEAYSEVGEELFQKPTSMLEEDFYVSYLEDDKYPDKH